VRASSDASRTLSNVPPLKDNPFAVHGDFRPVKSYLSDVPEHVEVMQSRLSQSGVSQHGYTLSRMSDASRHGHARVDSHLAMASAFDSGDSGSEPGRDAPEPPFATGAAFTVATATGSACTSNLETGSRIACTARAETRPSSSMQSTCSGAARDGTLGATPGAPLPPGSGVLPPQPMTHGALRTGGGRDCGGGSSSFGTSDARHAYNPALASAILATGSRLSFMESEMSEGASGAAERGGRGCSVMKAPSPPPRRTSSGTVTATPESSGLHVSTSNAAAAAASASAARRGCVHGGSGSGAGAAMTGAPQRGASEHAASESGAPPPESGAPPLESSGQRHT
jgi:hypothetical protein